jgi:translocation and assembly module TamB
MQLKSLLRRSLRWLGYTLLLLVVLLVGVFGLLQTSAGLGWAGGVLAGLMSSPGFSVAMHGLEGAVPWDLRARRIEISDDTGVWLALDNVAVAVAVGGLLSGEGHLKRLTVGQIEVARLPETAPAAPVPLSERLRLPRLPVAVALDKLAIERLALDPAILGERVEAAIAGRAVLRGEATEIALDLHRTDGVPGNLALDLRQSGVDPVLALRLTASEPTGLLLGRWLNRADRPALLASLSGEGPVSDWHGSFEASAGQLARLAGELSIAVARDTTVAVTGNAVLARLLPPEIATLTGDNMPIAARATLRQDGGISLDALSIDLAAGNLRADLALAGSDRAISGHVTARLPDLAVASGLVGQPVRGSAALTATLSGTEHRPRLQIDATGESIGIAASGAERAEAQATVAWRGNPGEPTARIAITAGGRLRGLAMPEGAPRELGRDLDWSLAATGMPDGSAVELTEFTATGAGIEISGTGRMGRFGQELDGQLRLSVADLRPFAGLFGRPVEGALTLDATAQQPSPDHIVARIDGTLTRLKAGIPAVDALAGGSIAIAGAGQRDPGGVLRLDRLTLTGGGPSAGASVAASGSYDPATQQLAATLDSEVRDLRPVGAALGTALSGQLAGHVTVTGNLDHPRVQARLTGQDVTAGTAAVDRIRLEAEIADATLPRALISGNFRSGGLDGTLSLEAEQTGPGEAAIRRMQLKAGDAVVTADLRIDLATKLARGNIALRAAELAPWSRLAGLPLAGRLDARAELDGRGGQSLDLTLSGDRLSSGAAGARVAIGHVAATARLNDLLGTPHGTARATLTGATFPSGGLASATLTLDSKRPGSFAFGAEAKGNVIEPLTLALDGTGEIAPGGAIDIRVARLSGALGTDRFQLTRPLTLSKRGNDLVLAGLALSVGSGQITGNAARRGAVLSADLTARHLPVAAAARLAGYRDVSGTASGDINIGGTIAAPQGRFSVTGRELRFALRKQQRLPTLGLDLGGIWNGRELALNGKVSGIKGDRLELSGTAPLVLTPTLGVAVPPQGRLALRLQGAGDIANLADLLPLGEDRVTGKFTLDGTVNGTPAAPVVSGQLTIADGRYENFATGAVLTKLRLDLAGDRDRLTLRAFSAGDTADGSLAARGGVVLGGTGPTADLTMTLKGFRILGRDEAILTASGTVTVAGAIASPKVTARLTTDQGDLTIPDRLPPSVTRLQVVEINSRAARSAPKRGAPKRAAVAPAKPAPPALPASLDIKIEVPGRVFVRGRGLDSEWRGRIGVTGTSEAPRVTGSLEATRGTVDFLGKTFKVVRGRIGFDGGAAIDPTLDIAAEIAAADITARVLITGLASTPNVAMSSTPVVPQDEILSRVLFGRAVGQITAAEGIQVAQAAATLAGGGPGVLDRLRGRLGLDRLVFGSAPSGMASSSLNPASGGDAAGTAISAGKYVAEGVYVGATQGLTPHSSKVIVEIEVRPRVTVQGDFSQSGGSGIGLNYKYDY